MFRIKIDKCIENSVFVKVSFENTDENKFIQELINIYCERNHIEPVSITVKGAYTNKLSKILRIEPKIKIFINPSRYKDLYGVLKQLLDGKNYEFTNNEEAELFANSAENIVKEFLKDHLENNELLEQLCYFHDRELGHEGIKQLQSKINNMEEVCKLIQQKVYSKKRIY